MSTQSLSNELRQLLEEYRVPKYPEDREWVDRYVAKLEVLIQTATTQARLDEVQSLAQAGNDFGKQTGSIEAGWAHIRDLIQSRIATLKATLGRDK